MWVLCAKRDGLIISQFILNVGPDSICRDTLDICVTLYHVMLVTGWLGSRVVSVLDSGAEGPGFQSQSQCCRVTVLGKLLTPIVPLFTKQRNW